MNSVLDRSNTSDLSFWLERLPLAIEGSQLQQAFIRPMVYDSIKEEVEIILEDDLCNVADKLADNEYIRTSLYISVIVTCISRYGNEDYVVAGVPPKKGNPTENLLPLVIKVDEKKNFNELLEYVDNQCREAYAYSNFDLDELIKCKGLKNITNKCPLFDYVIYDEDLHQTPKDFKQDITFSIRRNNHQVHIKSTFNPLLYQKEDINVFMEQVRTMLGSVLYNPETALEKQTMMSEKENNKVLVALNKTGRIYPDLRCIHKVFEQQAQKNPDFLAIKFNNDSLTYSEFNKYANKLADYLKKLGVGPEVPVGIYMRRSLKMMVSIYAVLKAGGAYVPLDPDYPQDRLEFITGDICPSVITTEGMFPDFLQAENRHIIDLDLLWEIIMTMPDGNPETEVSLDNMAYIIYTSGSTGKPKGAIITHRAICNRLYWMQEYFNISKNDKVLQKTPISFDVSVWELFWPLMYGAGLIIAKPEGHKDSNYIIKLINEENITTVHFVPSMLQRFLDNKDISGCKALKRVICSGEALDKHLVDEFFNKSNARLFNLYGPTEAAVDVSYYECKTEDSRKLVPIGKPIANCQLYILDQNLKPVPIGVPGELHIGGVCLARGYHNRPELTAEKFIPDPFSKDGEGRLYKTGDWARFRWDGEIEFLSRKDNQVKIRGFRIEMGEIENCISQHPRVSEAVVSIYEDSSGEKRLVGYVVPNDESDSNNNDVVQVDQWQKIFDTTYSCNDTRTTQDPMFDFSGWISSYTGKPIPQKQMVEWVSTTVERILDCKPRRVLEIGCGTGLLLYRIAPFTELYWGSDLSNIVVEKLNNELSHKGEGWSHVKVFQGSADSFSYIGDQKFDCIVINSVIQLFPSIKYLMNVIESALKILDIDGCLFLGDIRNYEQMELFNTSVQFNHSKPTTNVGLFKQQVMNRINREKELLIHPDFFYNLTKYCKEVSGVDVMLKSGASNNELNKFRFDVVIHKGNYFRLASPRVIDSWNTTLNMEIIESELMGMEQDELHIINISNGLVAQDSIIMNEISKMSNKETLKPAYEFISSNHTGFGIQPHEIYTLGKKYGKKVVVKPSASNRIDVEFRPYEQKSMHIDNVIQEIEQTAVGEEDNISVYANNPTQVLDGNVILNEVRQYLTKKLPDYMVPPTLMILKQLPLLPNGKLDRKSLPEPSYTRPDITTAYYPPRTSTEEEIVHMWSEILRIEQIGIYDSFFELGGHSLLALRLLSSLSENFGADISLSEFLARPTISNVSEILETLKVKKASDADVSYRIIPEPDKRFEPFALNDLQQAYFVGRSEDFELGNVATHVYFELECSNYRHDCFEAAINKTIERHDMLRCIFEGNGTQRVLESVPKYQVSLCNLEGTDALEIESYLYNVREEMSNKTLRYDKWPLFDVKISMLGNSKAYIHVYYDGLIMDAWSQAILMNEIAALYRHPEKKLKPMDITFRDYVKTEQFLKGSTLYEKSKTYWLQRIKEMSPAPDLPIIRTPETITKPTYIRLQRTLEKDEWKEFKRFSGKVGVTPFVALLTVFGKVLANWCRQQRFTLSVPGFNRYELHPEVNQLVGEFASFMFIDFNNEQGKSITELASINQLQFWRCMENRYFNGVEIIREIAKIHGGTVQSLMPVVFTSLLNMEEPENKCYKQIYSMTQTSQVWIDTIVSEDEGKLLVAWDCVKELFDESMLEDIINAFVSVLKKLSFAEESWHSCEWDLIPMHQRSLINGINQSFSELPQKTLSDLLEDSLLKFGHKIAVKTTSTEFTYGELFERAKCISSYLVEQGVKPNDLVGIVMVKGWEQIAAILGIVYAGAAYLPLAADLPEERLAKCLEHAKVQVVLTQSWISDRLTIPQHLCKLYVDKMDTRKWTCGDLPGVVDGNNLVYVIYTSGSTGFPKGVMVGQRGLLNAVIQTNNEFGITENDRVLSLTNLHHDMSAYDVFGILIAGGSIILPEHDKAKDPEHWVQLINENGVTVWNSVPAMMEMLLQYMEGDNLTTLKTLKLAFLGGDWIGVTIPSRLKMLAPSACVVSVGGPTETTLWNIWYKVKHVDEKWKSIPYGKPIANTKYHILNDALENVPIGVTGIMYCEGIGVAQGYLFDDENTKRSFITHPKTGARLYRTGDLGRYMPDGNIEFMGREDFQIKINGQRIELGEIEYIMSQYPGISNVIASVIKDVQIYIALYYQSCEEFNEIELKNFAKGKLPSHMIPKYYIRLGTLPLTANGKVDRKNLPAPTGMISKQGISKNIGTDVEIQLKNIYTEILSMENMEEEDNFFSLGGNSLTAIKVVRKIREELSVSISISEFFRDSSIKTIAGIVQSEKCLTDSISQMTIPKQSDIIRSPLSFNQEGVWFADHDEHSYKYCLPASINIRGKLDIDKFKQALDFVVNRHSILRTVFEVVSDEPVQRVLPTADVELKIINICKEHKNENLSPQNLIVDEARRAFDVAVGPLYRFTLIRSSNDESILLISLHHIISDEYSFIILIRDIINCYRMYIDGKKPALPEIPVQYSDYSRWMNNLLKRGDLDKEISYWSEKLSGNLAFVRLPMKKEPDWHVYRGRYRQLQVEDSTVAGLKKLCAKKGSSLFMGFCGVLYSLLYRITGDNDISFGTAISGRRWKETEDMIGFFVNVLLLRTEVAGELTFNTLIDRVKETITGAFTHQTLSFEKCIQEARLDRSLINLPYHVTFNYIDSRREEHKVGGISFEPVRYTKETVSHNLGLFIENISGKYYCAFSYKDGLFEDSTIDRIAVCFERIIKAIVENPEQAIIDYVLDDDLQDTKTKTYNEISDFDFS